MVVLKYSQEEIDIRIGELLNEHPNLPREVLNDLGFNNPEALFSNKAAIEFALNYEYRLGHVMSSNILPPPPPLLSLNVSTTVKILELV